MIAEMHTTTFAGRLVCRTLVCRTLVCDEGSAAIEAQPVASHAGGLPASRRPGSG